MGKFIYFYVLVLFFTSNAYGQYNDNDIEPHALFIKSGKNIEQGYYDGVGFTNTNISNNSFPQNEPTVRISRKNPNIVVTAWRDFRLGVDPPVRSIGYSYSSDGGITWSVSQLLPDPNPNHISQSDPVLTSDTAGYFYISSTSRQPVAGFNREMLLYRSTDNGQTFSLYSTAVPGSGGAGEDKEWIFTDPVPTNPTFNNIFMSWTSFGPSTGIKFRKSSNSGLNWSSTVDIEDNSGGQGSNLASGTNGDIYIVWGGTGVLLFDKSTNGGVSFGADKVIGDFTFINGFPFISVDYSNGPTRGNIYVVWGRYTGGNTDVYFQRSTDFGATWLVSPIRINDVTTNEQYWPSIVCDTNGSLYVVYLDDRMTEGSYNSYIAYSNNAGDTWINERLSDMSFPANTPNSSVRFGDYIGIDAYGGKVIPVWTDDRAGGNNQEIYSSVINFPTSISQNSGIVPGDFALYQNYPNPFNPSTNIEFDIKKSSFVKISVYNYLGQIVEILYKGDLNTGRYTYEWNADTYSSGVYFYKLETSRFSETRKMLLVK